VLGTRRPGPGTLPLSQQLQFGHPIALGDALTATVTVAAKDAATHRVSFECRCVNQAGVVVVDGGAEMMAASAKVRRPRGVAVGSPSAGGHPPRHPAPLGPGPGPAPPPTAGPSSARPPPPPRAVPPP